MVVDYTQTFSVILFASLHELGKWNVPHRRIISNFESFQGKKIH